MEYGIQGQGHDDPDAHLERSRKISKPCTCAPALRRRPTWQIPAKVSSFAQLRSHPANAFTLPKNTVHDRRISVHVPGMTVSNGMNDVLALLKSAFTFARITHSPGSRLVESI